MKRNEVPALTPIELLIGAIFLTVCAWAGWVLGGAQWSGRL